jgi:FKBP-type peptidyl-prolyl cis-trans isomerase FkpA
MRWRIITAVSVALLALPLATCTSDKKTPAAVELVTDQDKLSYAIGMNIAESLQQVASEIKIEILLRAIDDAFAKRPPLLTDQQSSEVMEAFSTRRRAEGEKQRTEMGDKNLREGKAFLETNAKAAGVVTTPSGLQYTVLTEGTGPKPKPTDKVRVHYRGTLIDGKPFDSSYDRGEPAVFQLNQVIRGWTEGLQLMNVGSKYKFVVPSELAYGPQGPPAIGPNAVLVFEVELLGIEGSEN